MKFYQIIAPVMLTMMHATAIFGAASPDYIFRNIAQSRDILQSRDIAQSIGEFLVLYKETAHIKPYPPFLRKLLFYNVERGNYGGPQVGYFEVMIPSTRFLGTFTVSLGIAAAVFTLWRAYMNPVYRKLVIDYEKAQTAYEIAETTYKNATNVVIKSLEARIKSLSVVIKSLEARIRSLRITRYRLESLLRAEIRGMILGFTAFPVIYAAESGLMDKIITGLLKNRTYIEYPPLKIFVKKEEQDLFYIVGSVPVRYTMPAVVPGGDKYYRVECRFLSNMRIKWKRLTKIDSADFSKIKSGNNRQQKRGNWIYKLENGKVNIYRSKEDLDADNKMTSISTKEGITTFFVDYEGEIIITGSKNGIRKWELMEEITGEEIRKEKRAKETREQLKKEMLLFIGNNIDIG